MLKEERAGTSADACIDNFERNWASTRSMEQELARVRYRQRNQYGGPKPLTMKVGTFDAEAWNTATVQVAVVRRAVRKALDREDFELLPDGRLLVDLGVGISAIVAMRSWARAGALRAALYSEAGLPLLETVGTHSGANGTTGPLVPRLIWLAGEGFAADVTFVGTVMLGMGSAPIPAPRAEPERRGEFDDDDDD